ncbi:MAG: Obg family GTPase CgtA [Candidatus Omnitrophota bacterium]
MFIDTARITLRAGKGGSGVNSFYRDKLNRKGFPDGGDGGNGGNIIIRVSTHVHTLLDFKGRHTIKSEKGTHGSSKQKRGRNGKPQVLIVPPGTLVHDVDANKVLKDLVKEGDEFEAAKGGSGGRGNRSRKDATAGEEGEVRNIFLELKLIADIGIVGLPNAGKSTLLSRLSKAQPRIAAFPFTTKNPVLGVVDYDDIIFKIAEIPGLIEDSHKGRGLGDKFLRHAERTRFYIHLLDISKPDINEILSDYNKINRELELYDKKLIDKPQIIVANKREVEGAEDNLKAIRHKIKQKVLGISAKEGIGLEELLKSLTRQLKKFRDKEI